LAQIDLDRSETLTQRGAVRDDNGIGFYET